MRFARLISELATEAQALALQLVIPELEVVIGLVRNSAALIVDIGGLKIIDAAPIVVDGDGADGRKDRITAAQRKARAGGELEIQNPRAAQWLVTGADPA